MRLRQRYGHQHLLKISVRNICAAHGIQADVESCSFGEALSYITTTDLVLTSPEWAGMLPPSNAGVAVTKNLIDSASVTETLLNAVKEHFPNEL